jgi:dipeptidyl aminopeptidase/acylaminoacyl peptidase
MFVLAADGSRNDRIWNVYGNYEDNARRKGDLTRGHPQVINVLEDDPNRVLVLARSFERRDGQGLSKLVKLDVRNGNTHVIDETPEYVDNLLSSGDASLLLATSRSRDYSSKMYLSNDGGKLWHEVTSGPGGYAEPIRPLLIEGRSVYALAQRNGSPDAPSHILRYHIDENRWEVVHDIGFSTLLDIDVGDDGELNLLAWYDDEPRLKVFDSSDLSAKVVRSIAKSYPGFETRAVSESGDGNLLLVHVGSGAHMGEYFLYDAAAKKARFLVANDEDFDGSKLSELQSVRFEASDGVTIPGWFQPVPGVEKPPLVVDIHGGPHGPYHPFGFNADWHLFNAMGYAVYAPNFRGSGGYGQGFERSGFGQWGTRMIDDMAEGARYLVEQGLVDPERICVYGGSYGGYGSAQSLVRHNELYRCGVIIAGVFDLKAMKRGTDVGEIYFGGSYMDQAIGADNDQLRDMSPIHNLDRIKAPMLVLHGKEDERTPFKGAVDFVEAAEKAGKDIEYHWYADEGHGNADIDNRIDEWRRIEDFLERANPPGKNAD